MNNRLLEILAAGVTCSALVAIPVTIFQHAPWTPEPQARIIHLTAIQETGTWTSDRVNGGNYWWREFRPAAPVLEQGVPVILRLTSMDVTHSLYAPALFPEALEVKAGYTEEIRFTPDSVGTFTYYCTQVCGQCHYWMQGTITVIPAGTRPGFGPGPKPPESAVCTHESYPAESRTLVRQGEILFNTKGCVTCHGAEGRGGIVNVNYVNTTVPELNSLAEKMKLYWKEDADRIVELLEQQTDLFSLVDDPPVEGYNRFLAQYKSIRDKIVNGAPDIQKQNPAGPEPPLVMPAWEHQLTDREIAAIVAWLLTEYPWEDWE